ncbi:MAG: hypothetical protein ACRDPQ_19600, partial [Nocardioidaceae bacterium]
MALSPRTMSTLRDRKPGLAGGRKQCGRDLVHPFELPRQFELALSTEYDTHVVSGECGVRPQ